MNRFDRVFSTLVLLQTRRVIKAMTIAERFGISLRTVYRDVRTLKNAGVPIIGDPGIGYSITDGYRLPPLMFNEGEAAALLTAEKFIGKVTDKKTQDYYSNAMIKIFESMLEKVNTSVISDPIVAENFFSCSMLMNVHFKGNPNAIDMDEICVYTVNNGKIVREEFFYTPPPQTV